MNQRIRELAEQAGAVVDEGPLAFAVVFGEMTDFEKFAELIVRECALMCLEDKDSQRILEHFGVES